MNDKPRPVPAPPPPVEKYEVDREWLAQMKDALLRRRDSILNVVRSNRDQLAESQHGYSDIGDRASVDLEDDLAAGLLNIEASQLEDINDALKRIDGHTYGLCAECGKPIPRKRLEILPFARHCLACAGAKERQSRMADGGDDRDDDED